MGRLHPRCNEMFFNTIITEWSPKIKNVFRNEGVRNSSIETVKYSISGMGKWTIIAGKEYPDGPINRSVQTDIIKLFTVWIKYNSEYDEKVRSHSTMGETKNLPILLPPTIDPEK